MYEAIRKGATTEELYELTRIKPYFIEQMRELVEEEEELLKGRGSVPAPEALRKAKQDGFSDRYLGQILEVSEDEIRKARTAIGVTEAWEGVHVSGTKDSAYYYSTYNAPDKSTVNTDRPKIMILGGGPNRIGQGIEFDYCCVHAAIALKKLGFETIIVNCNPETVSTDYDTSDKLYFEPLTLEDVLSIHEKEKPVGVIAQFGGQTPLNLAADLEKNGVRILGTSPEIIDLAEDRDRFRAIMEKLEIPMPEAGMAVNVDEALEIAEKIGYPVMVRPSYVLGGRGMEVVHDPESMKEYMQAAVGVTPDRPILIDRFLHHAMECEADAICDGTHAFVPAVMEHIELAGVHSGDSACILPSLNISEENVKTIKDYTKKIAEEMHVCGLMNMQYAIEDGKVFVLEANPRASRTVPLVSKVCNIQMVQLATQVITEELTGTPSPVPQLKEKKFHHYGVKEAVFPFNMFQEVDPLLGPEMRSTGEVLGLASNFGEAFYKAEEATQTPLPLVRPLRSFQPRTALRVCALGVAPAVTELGWAVSSMIINNLLVSYGSADALGSDGALAIMRVLSAVGLFTFMPSMGIAMGAQPIIGYNYGARSFHRMKRVLAQAIALGIAITAPLWATVILVPDLYAHLFGLPDQYLGETAWALVLYLMFIPILPIQTIGSNYFDATGQAAKATVLTLTRQILFLIPLLLVCPIVLPHLLPITPLESVWFAPSLSDITSTLIVSVFLAFEWRRLKRLECGKPGEARRSPSK